jgi:HTH-type transcriptional regulator / antitoxin HipB
MAQQLMTQKSAVSRMENHAEDVRLSTLQAYARVVGVKLEIHFVRLPA